MSYKILIADDEPEIRSLLRLYLENEKYEIIEAEDGQQALELLRSQQPALCILDIMMPKLDGYHVLQELRKESNIPVLILSAKDADSEKILGLNLGADDYLAKPFVMAELLARVNALVRRGGEYSVQTYNVGNTILKADGMELSVDGNSLRLAGKEVDMLSMFMGNPGRTIKLSQFVERLSDEEEVTRDMVELYISYLRNKLESLHANVRIDGNAEEGFTLVV